MHPTPHVSPLQASQAVFDAIPAPVFVKDREHRLVLVNRAFADMAGLRAEELMGRSDADFFPPEEVAIYWEIDKRVLATGETVENEEPVTFADGSVRACVTRKHRAFINDEQGQPQPFVVAVINDVTLVRDAEARARRAERLQGVEAEVLGEISRGASLNDILQAITKAVKELSAAAGASILLHDPERCELRQGAAFGLPESYVDATSRVPVGPCVGSCGSAAHEAAAVVVEDVATDPRWADWREAALAHGLRACTSTPIVDSDGAVLGTFAMYYQERRTPSEDELALVRRMTDLAAIAITRTRRDEALRETQARLERLSDAVGAAMWIANPEITEISYMSPSYERLTGRPVAELLARPLTWVEIIHPEDLPRVLEVTQKGSPAYDLEYRIVRADGEILWVHAIGNPVYDENGAVAWVAGIAYDITRLKEADQAARASEERFQTLAQNIDDMFWICDAETGRFLYISPGYERAWGRSADELYANSRQWLETVAPEDVPRVLKAMRDGPEGFQVEYRSQDLNGDYRWISTRGFPVRDATGKVRRLAGLSTDITRLKAVEQAARASEERFRILAETIDDVFWVSDPNSDEPPYVSPGYEKVWGRPVEELYNTPRAWTEAIYAEDRPAVLEVLRNQADGYHIEYRIVRPDGEVRWVSDRAYPVRDESGSTTRVVGLAQDITQMKLAEDAMRRSRDEAEAQSAGRRAILDSARDAIVTLDPKGRIEGINKAGVRMLGYEERELVGRPAAMLIAPKPGESRSLLERLLAARSEEDHKLFEIEVLRKDATALPVDVNVGELVQPDGVHFVAVLRDSTDRKRIERSKDEFISTVSHELRTPLTSIAGSLGLLVGGAAGELPERPARLISIAESNSRRLVRLINDILDIEKMQSGSMKFVFGEEDLNDLTARAVETMGGLATNLGVGFRIEAEGDAVMVRGDADRLTQVLTNLLSNAAKFSPKDGQIDVTVATAGPRARLSVRDHGPGIPLEFQERIFGKFAQADASDTRQKGGTGLGLAICKEIVDRHGGRIWFESEPGEGAVFHVELPLAAEPAQARAAERARSRRLLLCEDDPDIATFLAHALELQGFDAEVVHTIGAAERALEAPERYSALLLDLRLPDGNGLDLLGRLRARPDTHGLPVIVISADSQERVASGVDVVDWIQKPVDMSRLQAAVRQAVRASSEPPLVLYVDDDADLRRLVSEAFGERARMMTSPSLADARRLLAQTMPEVAILDIGLPDGSGLELLPDLYHPNGEAVPVVIFSARSLGEVALTELVDAVLTKSRTSLDQLTRTVNRLHADYVRAGKEIAA